MANVFDLGLIPSVLYVLFITAIMMVIMTVIGYKKFKMNPQLFGKALIMMLPLGFVVAFLLSTDANISAQMAEIFGMFG